jgi:carnitine 3-dehydrogenase
VDLPFLQVDLRQYVERPWPTLVRAGLVAGTSGVRLSFVPSIEVAVTKADFVQENGPERADFKARLFAKMDALASPDSILASSSSSLTMDVIQSECEHPGRCVIGHPFNPPHIVPLVQVAGGVKTSEATPRGQRRTCFRLRVPLSVRISP